MGKLNTSTDNVTNISSQTTNLTCVCCSSDGTIAYYCVENNKVLEYTGIGFGTAIFNKQLGGSNPSANISNLCKIACDSTGEKLIGTTRGGNAIYRSTDSGANWTNVLTLSNIDAVAPIYVASNSDGSVLYAALPNTSNTIIVSKDSGTTWSDINMFGETGRYLSIATSSTGDYVAAIRNDIAPNKVIILFYPTYKESFSEPTLNNVDVSLSAIVSYNNGSNFKISYTVGTGDNIYSFSSFTYTSVPPGFGFGFVPCFKEDSIILCIKDYKEEYVKIQDIRKGDFVKTLKNGYVSVNMIGKTDIYHSPNMGLKKEQLYRCSQKEYPELFEDLIITGAHSILVDNFINDEQKQQVIHINGDTFVTDGKYRLPACVDNRSSVYETEGTYTIYHFALDNDDYFMNYGIWANGLLVETCSKRYLKELSNMKLIT